MAVELFSIHCTTCKARLVVKDESVIGDILSCPKCGSMVQVVPPVGWKRPGAGDSSPGELPAVDPVAAAPAAASSKASTAPAPGGDTPPKKVAAAAAAIPPALPPRPSPQPDATQNVAHAMAGDSASPTHATAASTPAVPETAPSLFAAAVNWARNDWLLLASGLAGGIVLGAAVWLFVAAPSTAPVVVAEQAEPQALSADPANDEQASQPTAEPPPPKSPRPAESPAPSEASPEEPPAVADGTPSAESSETESVAATPPEVAEPEAQTPAPIETAEATETEESAPALKLDPIRRNKISPELAAASLPSAATTPPQELVPLEAEADDATEASPGEPGPMSREQIDERLAVSLAGVEFSEVPLLQFTAFIAEVSGVPITLDDAALEQSGPGRKVPISVKLTQTTAGDALRAAVERAGLSLAVEDGRIVISSAGASSAP